VADPGHLVAKPQSKQNLSGRRQQRTNLHASQFTTDMIPRFGSGSFWRQRIPK
jgi:hypothetical protein